MSAQNTHVILVAPDSAPADANVQLLGHGEAVIVLASRGQKYLAFEFERPAFTAAVESLLSDPTAAAERAGTGPAEAIDAHALLGDTIDEHVQLLRRADQLDLIASRGGTRIAFTFPVATFEDGARRIGATLPEAAPEPPTEPTAPDPDHEHVDVELEHHDPLEQDLDEPDEPKSLPAGKQPRIARRNAT